MDNDDFLVFEDDLGGEKSPLSKTLWIISLLSINLLSLSATAQENYFDLSLEELAKVTVFAASKKAESIKDAPAFVYVISSNDINMRGYSILSDILRDLPGFDTTEYGRAEFGTEISVRGIAGNNKTILLIDGVRVNSPGAEPLQVRGDISVRHAERIEVVYGPGSTLYGQDAINAVINIITKNGKGDNASEATVFIGDNNYREAFVSYGREFTLANDERLLVSAYIQLLDTDLTDFSKEYPGWWQELYQGSIAEAEGADPAIRWDEGLNINLNLETDTNALRLWYRKSSRSTADGTSNPSLYNRLANWEDEALVLNFEHIDHFTDNVSLYSTLNYKRVEIDPESRFAILRSDRQSFFTNRKYALATGVTWEERLNIVINDSLNLTTGLVWENHTTLVKTNIPEGSFDSNGNVVLQAGEFSYYTVAGDVTSLVTEARATELHYQIFGGYFEFDYTFNQQLSFVLGARQVHDEQTGDSPLSYRFATIYDVDQSITAKYIFSKAFSSAAPYFAYVNFNSPAAIITNNPNLEPEEALSHELNISWQGEQGFVGLSLYHNEQENLIQESRERFSFNNLLPVVYLDEAGLIERGILIAANGGESTAIGADLYGRYSFENRASLWASYSYVDYEAKIEDTVRGLQNISRNNIRLGLTYAAMDNLWITPSLVYRTTPQNFQSLRALEDEINNPYWINLFVRYAPVTNVEISLRVDNLSDNKIALKGSGGPLPQETRSIRLGFTYHY